MLTPVHLSNMREFCHSLKQKGCFVHNIQLPDPLENKKVASQSRRNMFFRSVGTLIGTLTRSNLHGHAAAKVLTIKATDEPAPALSAIRASALLVDIAADTRNSQETNGASNGAMEQWSNGAMEDSIENLKKIQPSSINRIFGSGSGHLCPGCLCAV